MRRRILIMSVCFLCLTVQAMALELELKFDGNDYSSYLWTTAGATHTYLPTGGWSGGAAKFTPPTSEGYCGLTNFGSLNSRRVNVRFLMYIGSAYTTGGNNKAMILVRSPYSDGTRQIWYLHDFDANNTRHQIVQNTGNGQNGTFKIHDRQGEWVSYEYESNLDTNVSRVYITTQDGTYNATVDVENSHASPGTGTWDYINILGGYWQEMSSANSNKYFIIDELKISTSGYIGPPEDFVNGRPSPPQVLRLIN